MTDINRILKEYETPLNKKWELSERLIQTEKAEPNNSYQIWILRDQIMASVSFTRAFRSHFQTSTFVAFLAFALAVFIDALPFMKIFVFL